MSQQEDFLSELFPSEPVTEESPTIQIDGESVPKRGRPKGARNKPKLTLENIDDIEENSNTAKIEQPQQQEAATDDFDIHETKEKKRDYNKIFRNKKGTKKQIEALFRLENSLMKQLGVDFRLEDSLIDALGESGAEAFGDLIAESHGKNIDKMLFIGLIGFAHLPLIATILKKVREGKQRKQQNKRNGNWITPYPYPNHEQIIQPHVPESTQMQQEVFGNEQAKT